jgi:hypothetical protein
VPLRDQLIVLTLIDLRDGTGWQAETNHDECGGLAALGDPSETPLTELVIPSAAERVGVVRQRSSIQAGENSTVSGLPLITSSRP